MVFVLVGLALLPLSASHCACIAGSLTVLPSLLSVSILGTCSAMLGQNYGCTTLCSSTTGPAAHLSCSPPLAVLQDPLADGNQANVIMLDIRKRKGLKPAPSPLNEYEDKL